VGEPLMRAMGGPAGADAALPAGRRRPVVLPEARAENIPEWLETTTVQTVNGTPSRALVAADVAHVAWAVNLACLGFHVWPLLAADPEHTDELRLDLDPQPGTGFAEARVAARELKALLDELGIAGFVKTTGNRGLHVYVRLQPRWDSYEVRSAAVAAARELERRRPDILTAAWWKEERGERIFLDYNQNAPHKTVFGAWSVRARVGAQVSTPIAWEELDEVDPGELTLASVPARVERDGDPWAAIALSRSSRCSRCTSATARTGSWTRHGRRSIRSSRTSRRASRRAGRGSSEGELADAARVEPLDPQPVGGEDVVERAAAELGGDGLRVRGVGVDQRLRRRAVLGAVVLDGRDEQPGAPERGGDLVERGEPDRCRDRAWRHARRRSAARPPRA
jgi:DNA ligase D-like protein (predicted polymerase)